MRVVIVEAAVLIEAGWYNDPAINEVWVVLVDRPVALRRLMERNSLSEEDAMKRISSQRRSEDLIKFASIVITNNEGTEKLRDSVNELIKQHPVLKTIL